MARLPTPGGDDGTWGAVLNDYLAQAHNTDGTLKPSSVAVAGAEVTSNKGAAGGYAPLDGTGKVPAANLPAAGATPDADATTKGIVQLAGDLSGTASSPQIAVGVIVDADVNATANISQSKINNLTTDLAAKIDESAVTTKGDLLAATGSSAITRLGVGADNQVLVADAAEATGIKWGTVPAPDDATTTTKGVVQLSGDLSGTATSPTVIAAGGLKNSSTTVSTTAASSPAAGQFLRATNGTTATWQAMPRMFGWYLDGVLVVGDGQGPIYRIDANVTILAFDLSAKVAPATTAATFDVEFSTTPTGIFTSIFSVLPTIAAGSNVGTAGTLSTTTLTAGDYVRFNVDTVGGTAAQGVTAQLRMETR